MPVSPTGALPAGGPELAQVWSAALRPLPALSGPTSVQRGGQRRPALPLRLDFRYGLAKG